MLTIDIVSDIVCPWCFIGLRRLSAAIELVRQDIPDFACSKRWQPFFLNPDTPPEGEPYLPFLIAKFGSRERVDEIFARIGAAGRDQGLAFAFNKIALRANTFDAHRLIHWAQQRGDAEALVENLFVAQFERGRNVGDRAVLIQAAIEAGHDGPTVEAWLASGAGSDELRTRADEIRRLGIASVPTYILDRRLAVVGAEDPAVLAQALKQAWATRA
ncbi:MAG TPA: DsbA family oxidoreductase [Zoogloea sp.]|nr:DsbA family oxidoreductase [Zoogloea sp.]